MFGRELTGRGVLMWLFGFFGLMLVANGFFLYYAITSYRGEDVPKSYLQGIEYNQVLERRKAQAELGWTVKFDNAVRGETTELRIRVLDKSEQPVNALTLRGDLRHPTDQFQDVEVEFTSIGDGYYKAILPQNVARYRLRAHSGDNDPPFVFELGL